MAGWSSWPAPAMPAERVWLRFGNAKKRKALANFSAGTCMGNTLFLAADEGAALDRLVRTKDGWAAEETLQLGDFLPLDDPEAEADLEGLAADEGWLWVLGSHARTREKVEKAPGERIHLDALADLKDTRSRCLLARIPLVEGRSGWELVKHDGKRRAGMLPQSAKGNAIARMLRHDALLGPFTHVPAKEGGVDVEGIAVCGTRVALGLRGPVIGSLALLLELELETGHSGKLKLAETPVRRLLALEGLGIRDLKRVADDLLILAGPTTALSGPCALYRWRGWAANPAHDPEHVHLHRPERILELPFGRGEDHPEGLALCGGDLSRIMVIYDSPADARLDLERRAVAADIFDLPG